MARKITLQAWAYEEFGDSAPKSNTLTLWAREGWILPPPQKIGRTWFVAPNARYYPQKSDFPLQAQEKKKPSRLIDRIPL